jgi:hypothetical protein
MRPVLPSFVTPGAPFFETRAVSRFPLQQLAAPFGLDSLGSSQRLSRVYWAAFLDGDRSLAQAATVPRPVAVDAQFRSATATEENARAAPDDEHNQKHQPLHQRTS